MEYYFVKYLLAAALLTSFVIETSTIEYGTKDIGPRQPRGMGRIVKTYSGNRPEPIHCDGEGFKSDPADCAVFYRCVKAGTSKFTVYRFECGPGTIYDPETEVCNHPKSTKRSECGSYVAQVIQELNNENDIGEQYNEVPFPISSQNPFYQATSQSTVPSSSPVFSTKYPFILPKKLVSTSTVSTVLSSTEIQKFHSPDFSNASRHPGKQNGDQCVSDGFMGDSENCRKFYRCVNNGRGGYIRYEFSCSESTIWDDETQACNHAWAVRKRRCGRGESEIDQVPAENNPSSTNDNNPEESVQEQIQLNYGSKVTQSQTQISNRPGKQNQTQINYGTKDPSNQPQNVNQNQTQISHGAVSQSQTQINYADKGIQTQLQIDHDKQNSQSQSQVFESTPQDSQQSEINTDEDTVSSDSKCNKSGFMGDANNCKKFYRCVENGRGGYIKYEFSCGEGTVWDPKIEACNHAWAVKECGGSTESPTENVEASSTQNYESTSKSTTAKEKENEISGNQEESVSSSNPQVPSLQSPEDDLDYDSGYGQQNNDQSTVTTTTTTTKRPSNQNDNCIQSGFIGDSTDCKKFYRCVDNGNGGFTRFEFSCGEGTVWDPEIDACNHAWAVKKCGGSKEDLPQNTNTTSTENYSSSSPKPISETSSLNPSTVDTDNDTGYGQQNNQEKPTTTTQKPSSQNECSQSGFMGDNNDCKKFYRCVENGNGGFTRYEFSCGEGTVWDPEIEACNHAWAVKKCGGSNVQKEETTTNNLNDETNENPTQPNKATETPESSNSVSSTEGDSTTAKTESSSEKTSDTECVSEGFMGDKDDCKKFHRCVDNGKGGYTKYDFTCGEGTVWDQEIQSCNHPTSDSCYSGNGQQNIGTESSVALTSTSNQVQEQPITADNQSTDNISTTKATTTKDQCQSEGFYANSEDCKKFYRCVDNGKGGFTKYDFKCGEGTVWVQEIQACDHDNDVNSCNSQTEQSGTTTTAAYGQQQENNNNSVSSTTEKIEQTSEGTTENTNKPVKQNDETTKDTNKCSSEGFYPDKNDCTKFYRCVDNGNGGYTKYDFVCGDGTAWDQEIQACNHQSQVSTCGKSQEANEANKPLDDQQGSETETTTTKPNDSTTQTTSSSESNKPKEDKCSHEGYFGNSEDCRMFYRCVDNGKGGYTKYDFTCGEGTIWDQDITACNHPQDVTNPSCQSNNNSTSSSSETSTTSSTSSSTSQTSSASDQSSSTTESSQSSSNCSQEDSTKKPQKQSVNCTKAGFYPDPDDCKKFYRCVDWDGDGQRFSVFHFDCGEGTIWDPELDTCNYEDSVYPPRDCSSSHAQNENTQESGTTTKKQDETTTTEQITTSDATTTQQSTSSQETTTQQSTSSEQTTTQQSTTSEPTTTQQSPTSQQTTTQESTTSEQTTTQQSTTSEPTTTQQSTTSQQTTTQESTTSEQTTTQQSTTSEQTTTQQSTSSEQTSTQQTTTSEQTTTQQSTTSEQTTTQQTTEQTTTQQSTSSEQTTTQQTTEMTATDSTTTTESSTQDSTPEQQMTTEQTSLEGTTSSSTETEQESTTESNSEKKCPETDEDQYTYVCPTSFRRHPKYCNMFYQCTEDDESHDLKIALFNCPNNTIYDENKTQCVEESKADKKCDGEIAEKRRVKRLDADSKEPIVVSKEKHACPAFGHFPFEKFDQCSPAFLKCQKTKSGKLRGFVYRCPDDFIYWPVSRRCEPKSKIKDCKHTANTWNGRWEIPIERRNVAPLK